MCPKVEDKIANSADPDQTAQEQSDLGLLCLLRPTYPSIWNFTVFELHMKFHMAWQKKKFIDR